MGLKQVYFVTVSFLESVHLFICLQNEGKNLLIRLENGARGGGGGGNNKKKKERNYSVTPYL